MSIEYKEVGREIKFRSLYEGKWYYQTLEEILTITLAAFRNGKHKTQYTGENDDNGKEIYEGDTVSYEWNDSWDGEWKQKYGVVEYENGGYSPLPNKDNIREFKVTGNIYENTDF